MILTKNNAERPAKAGLSVCRKSLAEFRGRSREIELDHFRRRRVRRRKYFSRSGVSNRPPLADDRGAERSASPFVEEGFAFFDKLRPGAKSAGPKYCKKAGGYCRRLPRLCRGDPVITCTSPAGGSPLLCFHASNFQRPALGGSREACNSRRNVASLISDVGLRGP